MYISVRLRLSFVILLVCDITSYVMNVHLEQHFFGSSRFFELSDDVFGI